tara:strand:- start:298 stop:609 length:312 start_codon:yes stop_codon:yes gene_type:complete
MSADAFRLSVVLIVDSTVSTLTASASGEDQTVAVGFQFSKKFVFECSHASTLDTSRRQCDRKHFLSLRLCFACLNAWRSTQHSPRSLDGETEQGRLIQFDAGI